MIGIDRLAAHQQVTGQQPAWWGGGRPVGAGLALLPIRTSDRVPRVADLWHQWLMGHIVSGENISTGL